MYALGRHIIVELRECKDNVLNDLDEVRDTLVSAAKEARATIVDISFHEFNPFGISGMVVIAESHLSIHTWPEHNYAAVDIFTCGDVIDPGIAASYIVKRFGSKNPSIVEIKRGILDDGTTYVPHKCC